MSNRNRATNKVEVTIEIFRTEGKWDKVIELAEELKNGSSGNTCLSNFLIGEGKLENFLEETPPIELNYVKAKASLSEARRYLEMVTGDEGRKAGYSLDAHLLLAKLCYACGQFNEAIDHITSAELNQLTEKALSTRSLRILAESYAVKGLCLEKKEPVSSSKFQHAELENEMMTCFEKASELGLLYLQGLDSSNPGNYNTISSTGSVGQEPRRIGTIIETILQRAPIVLIKIGKLNEAIERYRNMLCSIECRATQPLRLTLARQLAEVLLRGVSGQLYIPPTKLTPSKSATARRIWEPKKYHNKNQFLARNLQEETILLLLIAESLAVKDAVLSQSPEFEKERLHAMNNATAVYDLLSLAVMRYGQAQLMMESFEKALKFSFNHQHVWRQYSLSVTSTGKYGHAIRAWEESNRLSKDDSVGLLISARICYEHLDQIKEGIDFAKEAIQREVGRKGKPSRAHLYLGIGLLHMAFSSNLKADQERYNKEAFEALEKALQTDPNDHLVEYYLAYFYAHNYQIPEALAHIKTALLLRAEHAASLYLFVLLLTANGKPKESLEAVDEALEEFPQDLNLLHLKAHLQLYFDEVDSTLETMQIMFSVWKELYDDQENGNDSKTERDGGNERQSETKSVVFQMHTSQMSDKDSISVHAASIAASRIEQALSEAASSLSSFTPRPGLRQHWMVQLRIWLLLAEVYLQIDQAEEAMNCITEASLIYPMSHQLMYMKGQVYLYREQLEEAKQCFIDAVSVNPFHTEALRALGETHLILGEPRLAEKYLKDAVKIEPHEPKNWCTLARILEVVEDFESSADCLATALELEPMCPIIPFTTVSLAFE